LTILASWFVAETRLDWQQRFEQSPDLLVQYEVDALPKLSVANVRELLRASMPLPQLSPEDAAYLVVNHLSTERARVNHACVIEKAEQMSNLTLSK